MAILAAGLLPLLTLQGQFVRTVTQIERVEQSLSAQDNALNMIKTVNLTESPRGQVSFDGYSLEYEATAALPPQNARASGGFPGRFELTLYDVNLKITYTSGREETFTVRAFGWRAVKGYLEGI